MTQKYFNEVSAMSVSAHHVWTTHQSLDDPKCCALDSEGFGLHLCMQQVF